MMLWTKYEEGIRVDLRENIIMGNKGTIATCVMMILVEIEILSKI